MHVAWDEELACERSPTRSATVKSTPATSHFPLQLLCIQELQSLVGAQKKVGEKVLRNLFHCLPYHFYEKKKKKLQAA